MIGCLDIYSPHNLLLFVSACGHYRTARFVKIDRLLASHKKNIDYCYFLTELCTLIPVYAWRQRAQGIVKTLLKANRLPYNARYTMEIHADSDGKSLRHWSNRCLQEAGEHRPHWKKHVKQLLNLVNIPKKHMEPQASQCTTRR